MNLRKLITLEWKVISCNLAGATLNETVLPLFDLIVGFWNYSIKVVEHLNYMIVSVQWLVEGTQSFIHLFMYIPTLSSYLIDQHVVEVFIIN